MSDASIRRLITNLRELIAYSSEENSDNSLELCVQILDAVQNSLDAPELEWPETALLSQEDTMKILSAPYEELYCERKAKEKNEAFRLRVLRNQVKVEQAKQKLMDMYREAFPESDMDRFCDAIEFSVYAHQGQYRDSGEPYVLHPLEVAMIIVSMGMDVDAIIAGLLHDAVEDNEDITVQEVEERFGTSVAELVDGVTKLTRAGETNKISKEQQQAENVRKMFLAMAKDIRVIPIKLADRLHNMRTLAYCNAEKRVRKARETLEIYAPLAHRLGMGQIKAELEDLSFKQINPMAYSEIKEEVEKLKSEREKMLAEAQERIAKKLEENGIKASIHGRPKHFYSIYRKLQKKNTSFEEVHDLIALRVLVKTIGDCYIALGVVNNLWRQKPGRFKDYISTPKPNGYQSIHTTLVGKNGVPFEVQIRTEEMHKMAEFGIAAHWKYKEGREKSTNLDFMLDWMRQLMDEKIEDSGEFMRVLKIDFFSDYVFVFTPEGDIIDLVMGSTPIDFAYRIHSAVGNRCVGAKVNGKIVPLNYELQMSDIVEILTSSTETGPKRDWLNIAKTQHARNKIRQWFRSELKEENIELGKDMLEKEARRQGHPLSSLITDEKVPVLFKRLSLNNLNDMYAAVGYGSVTVNQIIPKLIEEYNKADKEAEQLRMLEEIARKQEQRKNQHVAPGNGITVKGESGMLVRLAKCCMPVPGDDIIGYITRTRGVSVHRADCKNLSGMQDGELRLIEVEWADKGNAKSSKFHVHIQVNGMERTGLMMDITRLFMNMNISLTGINAKTDADFISHITLEFEVHDAEQLKHIVAQIQKIRGVIDVFRVQV